MLYNLYDQDDIGLQWLSYRQNHKKILQFEKKCLQKIIQHNNILLDAMGGSCILCKFFPNHRIVNLDTSKMMLSHAKNCKFNVRGFVQEMPFKDNSFNAVTCLGNSLGGLNSSEINRFFSETYRVLKFNGKLILSYYDSSSLHFFSRMPMILFYKTKRLLGRIKLFLISLFYKNKKDRRIKPHSYSTTKIKLLLSQKRFQILKLESFKNYRILIAYKGKRLY